MDQSHSSHINGVKDQSLSSHINGVKDQFWPGCIACCAELENNGTLTIIHVNQDVGSAYVH